MARIALTLILMLALDAKAQKRIDLDDVAIKGELMNDGRLRVRAREPASIEDRVKYRTHYRNEIIESGELNESPLSGGGRQPAAFTGGGAVKKTDPNGKETTVPPSAGSTSKASKQPAAPTKNARP